MSAEVEAEMLSPDQVESLNHLIQVLDRDTVVDQLQNFQARFPIDFTPDFLANEPISRLRHILFGLCLHNQKTIEVAMAA